MTADLSFKKLWTDDNKVELIIINNKTNAPVADLDEYQIEKLMEKFPWIVKRVVKGLKA